LKALSHAQRATVGQDFSQPWILWIQPVREVEGFEAGIAAARVAAGNVAPTKSLYAVYQYRGLYQVSLIMTDRPSLGFRWI
jgi:hypothetical protein